jgi:hypothetical protein
VAVVTNGLVNLVIAQAGAKLYWRLHDVTGPHIKLQFFEAGRLRLVVKVVDKK